MAKLNAPGWVIVTRRKAESTTSLVKREPTDLQKYKELKERLLNNLTPTTAEIVAEVEGVGEIYRQLLYESPVGYRESPNLRELVLKALGTKSGELERIIKEVSLESKEPETGKYLAYGISTLKALGTIIKEGCKAIIYPLLPGKVQNWLEANESPTKVKSLSYHIISGTYGTAMYATIGGAIADYISSDKGFITLAALLSGICGLIPEIPAHGSGFMSEKRIGPTPVELLFWPIYIPLKAIANTFKEQYQATRTKLLEKKKE